MVAQDRGLVEGGQHDRDERPLAPAESHDFVHDEVPVVVLSTALRAAGRWAAVLEDIGAHFTEAAGAGSELRPKLRARKPAAHDAGHISGDDAGRQSGFRLPGTGGPAFGLNSR